MHLISFSKYSHATQMCLTRVIMLIMLHHHDRRIHGAIRNFTQGPKNILKLILVRSNTQFGRQPKSKTSKRRQWAILEFHYLAHNVHHVAKGQAPKFGNFWLYQCGVINWYVKISNVLSESTLQLSNLQVFFLIVLNIDARRTLFSELQMGLLFLLILLLDISGFRPLIT